jgi:hypothetical protein
MRTPRPTPALLALLCGLCLAGSGQATEDDWSAPYAQRWDRTRDATADLADALRTAEATGRLVLVVVGGETWGRCRAFERMLERDDALRARYRETFELVKVHVSPAHRNEEFLSGFPPVPRLPHFFVLEPPIRLVGSERSVTFEYRRYGLEGLRPSALERFVDVWSGYLRTRERPDTFRGKPTQSATP